jgi:hypothetical protein
MQRPSICLLGLTMLLGAPAMAQDLPTTGALGDMTIVGGALAQGQIARMQARKAGVRDPYDAASAANARDTCSHRAMYRSKLGARDPRVQRLYALCAKAGY